MSFYRELEGGQNELRFKLFNPDTILPLSDIIPVLENFGLAAAYNAIAVPMARVVLIVMTGANPVGVSCWLSRGTCGESYRNLSSDRPHTATEQRLH